MGKTIGIDLGTTNSVVAFATKEAEVLELNGHGKLMPSCVSYKNKKFIVGRDALDILLQYPENTVRSVKRLMGGTINSEMVQKMKKNKDYYGYKITSLKNGTDESVAIEIDGEQFTPEQISSEILKALKLRAEEYLKAEITDVVITVPAYFTSKQKSATLLAAEYAGLKVKKLLSEPLAAAIAYGVDNIEQGEVKTLIVYDFGGGTFDLSILKIANSGHGIFESESATGGDRWLGGDDIDMMLYKLITKKVSEQYGIQDFEKLVDKLPQKRRVRFKSLMNEKTEKAKILLSDEQKARVNIMGLLEDENNDILDIDIEVRREEFEAIIKPTIQKTIDFIDKLLLESHCSIEEVNNILLVGGSSCIPLVKTMLVEKYGKSKIVISGKPFFAIAEGAAIMANRDDPGEGGITNHNFYLGFQNTEGKIITKKVIDSGTPLPVSVKVPLKTTSNNQKIVLLPIRCDVENGSTELLNTALFLIEENLPHDSEIIFEINVGVNEGQGENETVSIYAYPANKPHLKRKLIIDHGQADTKAFRLINEYYSKASKEIKNVWLLKEFNNFVSNMVNEAYEIDPNNPLDAKWHEIIYKVPEKYDVLWDKYQKLVAEPDDSVLNNSKLLVTNYKEYLDPQTHLTPLQSLLGRYNAETDNSARIEYLLPMERINDEYHSILRNHLLHQIAHKVIIDTPTTTTQQASEASEKIDDVSKIEQNFRLFLEYYKRGEIENAEDALIQSEKIFNKYWLR